jgi:hypothetical protein
MRRVSFNISIYPCVNRNSNALYSSLATCIQEAGHSSPAFPFPSLFRGGGTLLLTAG